MYKFITTYKIITNLFLKIIVYLHNSKLDLWQRKLDG